MWIASQETKPKNLADGILEKYLDSYPCDECYKIKRYLKESSNWWRITGYRFSGQDEDIGHQLHSKFIDHIKTKHLPNDQEWEVLRKS